ncbi:MAG: type II secretion system protein GspF [Desulfuromonadales bacterium GWD2_61_12]|nr:MAG: type II secretion system protein GspF [Desulfuromonadales bacterium GWD2_61_12]
MPRFDYAGYDSTGRKVTGTVEGSSRRAALEQLRSDGIFPGTLSEEDPRRSGSLFFALRERVGSAELAVAARQLATLLGAGLPLDETLATVATQLEHPRLAGTLSQVREAVLQGAALHAALGQHPRLFPPLFIGMVEVGESSGTLDQALARLADFLEDQARLQSRITAALTYPLLMALVGSAVLFFLIVFVVPKITRIVEDLGQALPLPTLLLIQGSALFERYWWLLLLLALFAGWLLRRHLRTPAGRRQWDLWLLRAPLFGRLNQMIATARLTRTLATLLKSGMPLLRALEVTAGLLTNSALRRALQETATSVREGEGLAEPLRRSGVFPPMLTQMAAIGEKSGELEAMLLRVAESYEHQSDLRIAGLLALLEPMMILLMGGVVGFIVLAILLPIFQASSGMG